VVREGLIGRLSDKLSGRTGDVISERESIGIRPETPRLTGAGIDEGNTGRVSGGFTGSKGKGQTGRKTGGISGRLGGKTCPRFSGDIPGRFGPRSGSSSVVRAQRHNHTRPAPHAPGLGAN
jgi:hypothetical protein